VFFFPPPPQKYTGVGAAIAAGSHLEYGS